MIRFEGASASHVGQVRDINQDRVLFSNSIAAVADGMGGHAGGEVAAAIAIGELSGVRGVISLDRLVKVTHAANKRIFDEGSDPALRGMGTTLVAAVVDPETDRLALVNVGDSRAYRLRNGDLEQLTIDHSLVEDLVREGRLTPEEALTHPQRNIVTRVLGINPEVEIDSWEIEVAPGDRFVLCSDGLFNEVDDETISSTLHRLASSDDAAQELVDTALSRGGRDNVTVVVLDILDGDSTVSPDADDGVLADPDPADGDRAIEDGDDVSLPITERVDLVFDDQPPEGARSRLRRWMPFRSVVFLLTVLGVIGVGIGGSAWYARSAYFVDGVDGEVVILRGRPGGVLWFNPAEVENTELPVASLNGASQELLRNRTQWSSIDDAREFVSNLELAGAGTVPADAGATADPGG